MVRIKCVNPSCTGPGKSFEWDEGRRLSRGGRVAAPHADGAVRLTVVCPHCQTENMIWVTGVKSDFDLTREVGEDEG
jgi:hypothetical protein